MKCSAMNWSTKVRTSLYITNTKTLQYLQLFHLDQQFKQRYFMPINNDPLLITHSVSNIMKTANAYYWLLSWYKSINSKFS
jgi:hypothetical protein